MLKRLFFTFFLLLIGTASAAPDLSHPLTLADLVDIALENQPATRQVWWNAKRAAAALESAKTDYYPTLDLDTSASHGRTFKFVNGPDTNYTILGADLVLSMMLYDFGQTRANVKAAKLALSAANWQTEWKIQEVLVDVLQNAYGMLHAQEVVQASVFSLEDAERMLNVAAELNRSGITPVSDLYLAKANYAQMKMTAAEKRSLRDIQHGKLAASLGLSPDAPIELAPLSAMAFPQLQQTSELIAAALGQRKDLMAKQAKLSEAVAQKEKIRSLYRPRLSLSGTGGANHAVHDKANAMQYDVTATLRIPLFAGFDSIYQNRMAFADEQQSREELAQLELDIALEVLANSRELEAALELMPEADEYLKNSLKAYDAVIEIYQSGKEGITEVSQAQRQLADARVLYSDIQTRRFVALAKLAYSTGTLSSYLEGPCEIDH